MNGIINKKTISAILILVVVVLLFFSKTIFTYNLAVVTGGTPKNGRLTKEATINGISNWKNVEKIYSPVAGKISSVEVEVGDFVKKDDLIFTVEFDEQEVRDKLNSINVAVSQAQLDIKNLELKIADIEREIEYLEDEDYSNNLTSDYEKNQLNLDIRNAREKLSDVKELNDEGEASDQELDEARHQLRGLLLKQEYLEDSAEEKSEDSELDREKKLQQFQNDKESLENTLASNKLSIQSQYIQANPYRKSLEEFETYAQIKALSDGIVTALPISQGESITDGQLLMEFGASGSLAIEGTLPIDNDFVSVGNKVFVSNANHSLEGVVKSINPEDGAKKVSVTVKSNKITAGESFSLEFAFESETKYTLVPNEAVNQDSSGYFINQIKRREGILGEEYYLEKLTVYIGKSDLKNTAITAGITFFEPIAISSDKSVQSGDTVLLGNEADFFES